MATESMLMAPAMVQVLAAMLFGLGLTAAVVREAVQLRADLVVAYHPPLFRPWQKLAAADPQQQAALAAFALFVAFAGWALWTTWKAGDDPLVGLEARAVFAGLAGYLVCEMANGYSMSWHLYFLFACGLAAARMGRLRRALAEEAA